MLIYISYFVTHVFTIGRVFKIREISSGLSLDETAKSFFRWHITEAAVLLSTERHKLRATQIVCNCQSPTYYTHTSLPVVCTVHNDRLQCTTPATATAAATCNTAAVCRLSQEVSGINRQLRHERRTRCTTKLMACAVLWSDNKPLESSSQQCHVRQFHILHIKFNSLTLLCIQTPLPRECQHCCVGHVSTTSSSVAHDSCLLLLMHTTLGSMLINADFDVHLISFVVSTSTNMLRVEQPLWLKCRASASRFTTLCAGDQSDEFFM